MSFCNCQPYFLKIVLSFGFVVAYFYLLYLKNVTTLSLLFNFAGEIVNPVHAQTSLEENLLTRTEK